MFQKQYIVTHNDNEYIDVFIWVLVAVNSFHLTNEYRADERKLNSASKTLCTIWYQIFSQTKEGFYSKLC